MSFVTKALRSLPFGRIIGGPMTAAIEAQALAARSTVDFIKSVGFVAPSGSGTPTDSDFGEVRSVTFSYKKKSINPSGSADEETVELIVPILTIVPIPYIRIDELTIDFTASITEQHEDALSISSSVSTDNSINAKFGNFLSPVNVSLAAKVSTRFNSNFTSKNRVNVEATIDVHLRAVQDEMPAGLAKVLSILENSILEKPKP